MRDEDVDLAIASSPWTAAFRAAGVALRATRADGLAAGRLADGLDHDEEAARTRSAERSSAVRLAAADLHGDRSWRDGHVHLLARPHPDGGWFVTLRGARVATLVADRRVPLREGEWERVPTLADRPVLELDGRERALHRER